MYAVSGKFAQLDDIMDDLVDGVELKKKVADEYENSIYYPDSSGAKHTYRLPWTAGVDNVKEFMKYDSPDNFDTTKSATYAKLKDATKMLTDLVGNSSYTRSAESNHDAQKDFNNGYAAMMFNGEWIYNEIKGYQINNAGFELGVMKTPTAANAVSDAIYTIGEDQYIAVPASSTKQDLAKEFIKLLVSDFGCQTFIDQANGLLAYDITTVSNGDISSFTQNTFMQELYSVKSSYAGAFTNYPDLSAMDNVREHNAMIYLANNVDVWSTGTMRPYKYIIEGTYTLDQAFNAIAQEASSNWSSWQEKSGVIK